MGADGGGWGQVPVPSSQFHEEAIAPWQPFQPPCPVPSGIKRQGSDDFVQDACLSKGKCCVTSEGIARRVCQGNAGVGREVLLGRVLEHVFFATMPADVAKFPLLLTEATGR